MGRGRESARARSGAGMDRIREAAGGLRRLGDPEVWSRSRTTRKSICGIETLAAGVQKRSQGARLVRYAMNSSSGVGSYVKSLPDCHPDGRGDCPVTADWATMMPDPFAPESITGQRSKARREEAQDRQCGGAT